MTTALANPPQSAAIPRREFIKLTVSAAGGLLIGFHLQALAEPEKTAGEFAPNAFVHIGRDESVTVIVNHSEMGQGIYTALPQILADELDADWRNVRFEPAPVDPVYNHPVFGMQMTGGSTSTWSSFDQFRKPGAMARAMLIAAAAEQWNVDPTTCHTDTGKVIHSASNQSLTYGKLVDRAASLTPPKEAALKDPKDYKLIGKPIKRLDTADKTNGKAVFGIDIQRPGMLVAVVARSPVFGGKLETFDPTDAMKVPGVRKVVQVPSGVAVIATGFWPAKLGREKLKITWHEGGMKNFSTDWQRQQYKAQVGGMGVGARHEGDPANALKSAAKTIQAQYEVPYLSHAMMEPLNCTVDLRADHCEIWVGTQFQTVDRAAAAEVAGLKPEQVEIHTTFLGGGFGRRANPASDFVREAVSVAKAAGAPVKVIWTREDDMHGGYYRPMYVHGLAGGLDAQGNPVAWLHEIVGQSILTGTPFAMMIKDGVDETSVEGAADLPYTIPNLNVVYHQTEVGVPVLWLRSVGHSHTAFVTECFLDELAAQGGKDPVELRRALLTKSPRHLGVLNLAVEKSGWGKRLPEGRGRGVAVHASFGSFNAQVAEVSVDPKGKVHVHRVVCAIDCGKYVNPSLIEAQMHSGIIFGLTAALYGELTFENGRVQQSNFHDYQMVRMNEAPEIEVHIVQNQEKSGGVGEVGVPCIAPAVANAIFAATGKRIRKLPIRMNEAV